jgi:hypothetical protein
MGELSYPDTPEQQAQDSTFKLMFIKNFRAISNVEKQHGCCFEREHQAHQGRSSRHAGCRAAKR